MKRDPRRQFGRTTSEGAQCDSGELPEDQVATASAPHRAATRYDGRVSALWPRALLGALAVLILVQVVLLMPGLEALVLVSIVVWLIVPGVRVAAALVPSNRSSAVAAWVFGPALGLGFSVVGVFLFWAVGVQNWVAIAAGPSLTWLLSWLVRRYGGPSLRLPRFTRHDLAAVTLALTIVPLVTWAPYANIRADVGDGEAYRAYFTADFVWAMTVTNEIAKGDVPPQNPFLRDQPMRYYWMAHFLSGAEYRNLQRWGVRSEQVVLVNGVFFGLVAVGTLYGLVRCAGAGPWSSLVAVAAGFLANSFEGIDLIRAIVEHGQPWSDLRNTNIDAVTRWFYHSLAVDGLHRLLLYQPHHLTGYLLGLSALWLVGLADDVTETSIALWAGVLLAMTLIFSTFTALIVGLAVALLFAMRLWQQGAWRSTFSCLVLGAGPVVAGLAIVTAFGYSDPRFGSLLTVGMNPLSVTNVDKVFVLSFGPLLLGAFWAVTKPGWLRGAGAPAAALTVAALIFYFFTNVPDSGDVWVGWRAGHLLLISFAAASGMALHTMWAVPRLRLLIGGVCVLLAVLAVPTVAIDVYNAQDVNNRNFGATFPWTLVVTQPEREGLEWIRTQTAIDAVVQTEPYARGPKHWAFIQAFAERRGVAGLPGSMIPATPYQLATDDLVWGVFRAPTGKDAHDVAAFMGIDYIVFGSDERQRYGDALSAIRSRPDLFAPMFENSAMEIFRVEHPPAAEQSSEVRD